jgi:hypothetical protein
VGLVAVAQAAVVLVLATRLALRHLKAVTVAQAQPVAQQGQVAVAVRLPLEQVPVHQKQAGTVVMELRHPFLAAA